jgi:hypothetical protein
VNLAHVLSLPCTIQCVGTVTTRERNAADVPTLPRRVSCVVAKFRYRPLESVGQREHAVARALAHEEAAARHQLAVPSGPVGKGERALLAPEQRVEFELAIEPHSAGPFHAALAVREALHVSKGALLMMTISTHQRT